MTNNEKPVTTAELEQAEKKRGKLNAALRAVGIREIPIDSIIDGIKAGTITPNETLGMTEEILKVASGVHKAVIDRVKDACIDLSISSLALKVGKAQKGIADTNEKLDKQGKEMGEGFKKAGKALQDAKGELEGKIAGMGNRIDGLEEGLGSVKQGLNDVRNDVEGLKSDLEAQGHELKQAMSEMKSELQEQIHQQAELFDHKLQQQDAKFTQEINFESLEQEYTRQTKTLNAKIADHQDRLEDYQEELNHTKLAQKKLDHEFRDILEDTETQTHLLQEQAAKLEFVAQGMEEIAEETHERLNKLHQEIFDLDEKTEEALFTAKKAVRKIDNLTDELAKERQLIQELEAQIQKNQLETALAKQEARLANERLDNLIKTQQLSDFTAQELAFSKLQKTLQLKADEAKLLAQLNILQQSHTTLTEELAERE
ncbi:9991_t:CDS:2 [Entrophospora sp. SA101]|nr:1607_t:CDS:2 [Entrophospora sp. SA101]CAJ0876353.1 9991_t:CDS:2 [Entrophospora sp. SA101]